MLFDSAKTLQKDGEKTKFEEFGIIEKIEQQEAPKLKLKHLPEVLKYTYLGEEQTYSIVISSILTSNQEGKFLFILKKYKNTIGWTLNDIKSINLLICTHQINLKKMLKHINNLKED